MRPWMNWSHRRLSAASSVQLSHTWRDTHCKETTLQNLAPHLGFFVCHGRCCVCLRLFCCGCAVRRTTLRRLQRTQLRQINWALSKCAVPEIYSNSTTCMSMFVYTAKHFNDEAFDSWCQKYLTVQVVWGTIISILYYSNKVVLYTVVLLQQRIWLWLWCNENTSQQHCG